jgi:HK97 family phage portal protein
MIKRLPLFNDLSNSVSYFWRRVRARHATKAALFEGDNAWGRILSAVGAKAGHLWPDLSRYTSQADLYVRASWVYIAINKIATAAALVALNAVSTDGEEDQQLYNHPIEQLLRKPNQWMSRFELLEQTFGFLELTGNAYWLLTGPGGGAPTAIMPLRPDRMRIVAGPDMQNYVSGYVYLLDGVEIPLAREEVIHFKRWNPNDDFYGLSALEAAALAAQTDLKMTEWQRNFFGKENGIPAGIVAIKSYISDSDFERIQREWVENYSGKNRKTAFIRGAGEVDYKDMSLSQREMDFIQSRQMNKEEIMLLFGIPPGMLDKNATEANAEASLRVFNDQTLWPKMVAFCEKLTAELAPFFGGSDLKIVPEDIRVADRKAELMEVSAAASYLTINEIRAKFWDRGPVDWGDVPATGPGAMLGGTNNIPGSFPPNPPISASQGVGGSPDASATLDSYSEAVRSAPGLAGDSTYYAILDLANNPEVAAIQNQLKGINLNVDWVDPATFYVPLVAGVETAPGQIRFLAEGFDRAMSPVSFDVGPASWLYGDEGDLLLALNVSLSPALDNLQQGLCDAFQYAGLEISDYSQNWQPCLILGYANAGDVSGAQPYDVRATVTATRLKLVEETVAGDSIDIAATKGIDLFHAASPQQKEPPRAAPKKVKEELQQFVRYIEHGKNPENFQFHVTPLSKQIEAKALLGWQEYIIEG